MKKKLALLLALVLVLTSFVTIATACNNNKGLTDDQLKSLIADVKSTHNSETTTITNSNYNVFGKAIAGLDGTEANVKWTSSAANVTVSGEANSAGYYTVTIPDRSTLTADLQYTLTATLVDKDGKAYKDSNGDEVAATFNHTVQMLGASYAVITFDSKDKAIDKGAEYRDSYNNLGYEYMTWTENDITVKAVRGESTSGSADYINPARFYSKSTLEISYVAPMKAIKITLDSATSNAGGFDGMKVDGTNITRVDDIVVIELTTPATKFESAPLNGQTRVKKIEVYTNEVPALATDPEPTSHDTSKSVNDLATTPPDNMKLIYEVEGVWVATTDKFETPADPDDKNGSGLLYDKTTGKSLKIYGMADSADAFEWGGKNYGFTNPKKFQEIKANFNDGDMIKLGVAYSSQYSNYYSYFISKTADASTITYSASVSCTPTEGGTATLSKDSGLKYGDEVTININAQDGYDVTSVTLDGKNVSEDQGAYKFNVVPGPNAVVVTFADANATTMVFEITAANLLGYTGTNVAYNTTLVTKQLTVAGSKTVTLSYLQYSCYGDGIQTRISGSDQAYLFNSTAFEWEIESIEFVATSGKESKGVISIAFGASALEAAPESYAGTFALADGTKTINCNVDGAKYFRIQHTTSGAMYLQKIVIHFKAAAAPAA